MVVPGRRVASRRASSPPIGFRSGTPPSPERRARDAGSAGDGRRRRSCIPRRAAATERRNSAISTHSGWVSAAEHGQDGLLDGGCLLGAERPLGEGGQLDAEEGVGVLDRLRDHAGDPLLEQRSALVPVEAARGGSRTSRTHPRGRRFRTPRTPGSAAVEERLPRLGNDTSVGSSRVSVCTFSGWSRASWAAIAAPLEWPAM